MSYLLMIYFNNFTIKIDQIPQEFASELRLLYITVSELLKPFYKQFPLFTKDRRTTAKRLSEALTEFKKVKVENFEVSYKYWLDFYFFFEFFYYNNKFENYI